VIVPVSAVVLTGLLVVLLVRYAGLKFWHALIAALFGFFVASTTVAPQVRAALTSVINVLSGHGPVISGYPGSHARKEGRSHIQPREKGPTP
jgi:hypothetical protein